MSEPMLLASYHDTVVSSLKALPWVVHAAHYPETRTQFLTPAVFLVVNGWQPSPGCTGQTPVTLDCDLFVVCDMAASDAIAIPEVYARAAAADLSRWIDGQTFDVDSLAPAEFTGAVRDDFDPLMDDYLVFRVSYTQDMVLGLDPFAPSGAPLQGVYLGKAPDTGTAHVNDYQLICGKPAPHKGKK